MALEEIEKLKEKVEKDPNSKLFVPLADEYRKAGMLDDAIAVLLKGLNNQPGYMSARVSLGKIYLEKNMTAEAKEEFNKVVSAIPDNLFAHKKLADICRDLGDNERAIGEYKTVLKLNPLDDDALAKLKELQSMPSVEKSAAQSPVLEKPSIARTAYVKEAPAVEEDVDILPAEAPPPVPQGNEFNEFKKILSERSEIAEDVAPVEDISVKDMEDAVKEALNLADTLKETKTPIPEVPIAEMPQKNETEAEIQSEKAGIPKSAMKDAELFISKGDYHKAMNVYRELLSVSPGDKYVLQKIEELKMLLKMIGKEKEVVIDKLESLGEGIKKKRDEFFRNP